MHSCKFCGAALPDQASFCGTCGKKADSTAQMPTRVTSPRPDDVAIPDAMTVISTPGSSLPEGDIEDAPTIISHETDPYLDDGEDEEKRRRRALAGLVLPLLGDALLTGQPEAGAPVVQGTSLIEGAPVVSGQPHLGGPPAVARPMQPSQGVTLSQNASVAQQPIVLSTIPTTLPPYNPPGLPGSYPPSSGSGGPASSSGSASPKPGSGSGSPLPGCNVWIVMVVLPIIILASIFGITATFYVPNLSLTINGHTGTGVALGSQFDLHGNNFVPGTTVTFKLDNAPFYFASHSVPTQQAHNARTLPYTSILGAQLHATSLAQDTTIAGINGAFDVTIAVGQGWTLGTHTITASESLSPHTANLTFIVYEAGTTPTPTLTPTSTPTASPTATASPSATSTSTQTPGQSNLSNVTPDIVNLGPTMEGNNQTVTQQIALNTIGTDIITWNATWDQQQAPWLHLDHTSGQIQAPAAQQLTVSAAASSLTKGTYSTTIVFSSMTSNQTIGLSVTLTVLPACITATPGTLNFTGTANVGDPAAQTVVINNCGQQAGNWSLTGTHPNWLNVSATNGTLNSGDTQTITVNVTNLEAKLAIGNYQDTLTFAIGSAQVTVQVSLTVQSAPTLSVSPSSSTCQYNFAAAQAEYDCTETLASSATPAVSINWTATSADTKITFTDPNGASSGSLQPGSRVNVVIHVPATECQSSASVIFSGPANQVSVSWQCGPPPIQ